MIVFSDTLSELELTSEAANKLGMSLQFNWSFPKVSLLSTFGDCLSVTKNVLILLHV